jgi:excisionase family DNA binding protein
MASLDYVNLGQRRLASTDATPHRAIAHHERGHRTVSPLTTDHPRPLHTLPPVLRVSEVADVLRCDPSTVYSMVRRGELPSIRVGRNLRFSRDQLERFLGGSTV